ncbi:MAG TPA: GAF domain-containing protein, partial [Roseiflexaceae bacterium]
DLLERLAQLERRGAASASSAPAGSAPAEGVETVRPHYAFLVDASLLLAVTHDDSALARVAELAVPVFADLCMVDLIEDGGQVHRLASASTGAIQDMFGGALDKPGGRDYAVPPGIARVLKSGEPHLVPSASDLTPLIRARAAGRAAVEHEFAPLSWMIVPLQARGQVLGAITCISVEAHHRYAAADLALAQELAQRAAIAVDRARMYREAR